MNPLLLFDGQCAVCRRIGGWVQRRAASDVSGARLDAHPIGDDPQALKKLNPTLDIWDAYQTIHVLMPDGSMKLGGEAIAEVLRDLPGMSWFTWTFSFSIVGLRPFQAVLNLAYLILSDVRPLFGCESCGTPSRWVRPIRSTVKWFQSIMRKSPPAKGPPHFTTTAAPRSTGENEKALGISSK